MITQPGSYYLTGNITGVSGKRGIEIATNGVTLDLNGFEMVGVAGATDGIATNTTRENITIRNGVVRDWPGDGVDVKTANSRAMVIHLFAYNNGATGIAVGGGSRIENCVSHSNIGSGYVLGIASSIQNSTAYNNSLSGIITDSQGVIHDCLSYANTGSGIEAAGAANISRCVVNNNDGVGISCSASSLVRDCTVRFNGLDGILASSGCQIRDNVCVNNGVAVGGGAGIHLTGADNRVEGNLCTTSSRGIDVDAAGNFIARNTCSGNSTNWDVVAGNVCLVVSGTTSAAITGNSGGVSPGSTDPNANFSF